MSQSSSEDPPVDHLLAQPLEGEHADSEVGRAGAGTRVDRDGLVVVLETFDETLLAVIRSVLEESQIPFVVRGHGAAGLDSLVQRVAGMFSQRAAAIRILVPAGRADEAASLLSPVEGSFPDIPELADDPDEDPNC